MQVKNDPMRQIADQIASALASGIAAHINRHTPEPPRSNGHSNGKMLTVKLPAKKSIIVCRYHVGRCDRCRNHSMGPRYSYRCRLHKS